MPPANPAFSLLLCPIPPSPFPAGRGSPKVYFAGGFAPGTPALNRLRHLQTLPSRCPMGSLPGRSPGRRVLAVPDGWLVRQVAGSAGVGGAQRVVCLLCRLPTLPLALFLSPIPPPALAERSSPPGKGDIKVIFMQGASPLASPRAEPMVRRITERKRFPASGAARVQPPGTCMARLVSAASGLMPGCRGRSPRRNKLWISPFPLGRGSGG